jgi:excisionase family DNA binding protein
MKPRKLERLWTPTEIATALKVHPSTVTGWIRTGRLPAVDDGKRRVVYFVGDSDLRAYLDSRRTAVPLA